MLPLGSDGTAVVISLSFLLGFLGLSFAYFFIVLVPADSAVIVICQEDDVSRMGEGEGEEDVSEEEDDDEGAGLTAAERDGDRGEGHLSNAAVKLLPLSPPMVPAAVAAATATTVIATTTPPLPTTTVSLSKTHQPSPVPGMTAELSTRLRQRRRPRQPGNQLTFSHSVLSLSFSLCSLLGSLLLAQWISPFMFFSLELRLIVSVLLLFLAINLALTACFVALIFDRGRFSAQAVSSVLLPRSLGSLFSPKPRRAPLRPAARSPPAPPPTTAASSHANKFRPFQPSPLSLPALTPEDFVTLEAALVSPAPSLAEFPAPHLGSRKKRGRKPLTLLDAGFLAVVALCSLLNCGHFSLLTLRSREFRGNLAERVGLLATMASIPLTLLKGSLLTAISFVLFAKLNQWNIPLILGLLGGVCTILCGLLESAVLLRLTLVVLFPRYLQDPGAADPRRVPATSFSSAPLPIRPLEVVLSTLFFTAALLFFILEITHLHTPSLMLSFAVAMSSFLLWFNSLLPGLSSSRSLHLPRLFLGLVKEAWYYIMEGCLILVVGGYHLDHHCTWRYLLFAVAAFLLLASALSIWASPSAALEGVWRPSTICLFVVLVVWLLPLYLADPELSWPFVRDMAISTVVTSMIWLGISAWIHLQKTSAPGSQQPPLSPAYYV